MKRFSLRLEDELHEKLRVESFQTGVSMNEIIVEAVKQKYKGEKERLRMKKELNILKNKEDGDLTLGYAGIDLEDYKYITVEDFIGMVEEAEFWDMIEPEIYEKALEDVGLNYGDYDDPDMMWGDFLKAVNKKEQLKIGKWT